MAQADYLSNAIRALITGAGAKPSTNPVRSAHAEFVTALAGQPPWPMPLFADASDIEDRADHVKKVLDAVSAYVTAILDDTAQNIPGGLDLRQVDALLADLASEATGTIQGAPHIKDEHPSVFDCSFRPQNGNRFIAHMGHIRMMGAVQPFISGAISKTINMPEESTVEDVVEAYTESWKLGLKAVAIYRDGSKRAQPLSSSTGKGEKKGSVTIGMAPQPQTIEKIV